MSVRYIAEVAPPSIRGRLVGFYEIGSQGAQMCGFWVNYAVNKTISSSSKSIRRQTQDSRLTRLTLFSPGSMASPSRSSTVPRRHCTCNRALLPRITTLVGQERLLGEDGEDHL